MSEFPGGTDHRIPRDSRGRRLPCALCDMAASLRLGGIALCLRHWTYAMGWPWRVPVRRARLHELRELANRRRTG